MKKNRLFTTICLMAAILLAACTQDELAEQGNTLPDGEYPLQIGSVSIIAESSEEPWTRVTEKPDGSGSVWQPDDAITVSLDGETATYTYDGSAWTSDAPLYWKNTQPAEVTAWYPATDGALYLGGQDNGLVYVLRATADNASHNTPVNLQFEHQLAKVRVIVKGTADVIDVEPMNVPMSCDVKEGKIVNIGTIIPLNHQMFKTTYEDIGPCWEINLPPSLDYQIEKFMVFTSDPIDIQCDITPSITLEAGKVHTITITANRKDTQTIDLSNGDYTISSDGIYYFSGTASHAIKVTGGNPEIYLEDAQISMASGNAIDIQDGSPTIHVRGEGNTVASTDNTGIAVSGGATLTIEGRSTADMLTATAGNGGAGIGSPLGGTVGGNITIGNVTIHATGGSGNSAFGGAGIGSSGSGNCGDVTITDAVIMANGGDYSSGIGMGYGNTSQPSIGKITITNSDVTAKAGRYASAIGFSYTESVVNPTPDYRAGQIIITTDNLETFLSKLTAGGTAHAEFAAYTQRIGVGSHAIPYPPSLLNQDGSGPWEGVVINGTVYADGYE
ncbi:fimbrillin family protein [Mediterranea sp. An20]|uniref:fimbrillin family protein n=1 Tax=Mediterranea sp. An20 TaxID=1965586 RepID=UPI0013A65909|nr:fimbrillin family protein [Mediterranea sp. An20]